MNKELLELLESIKNKKEEARTLAKTDAVGAKAMLGDIKAMEDRFEVELALFEGEKEKVATQNKNQKQHTEMSLEAKAFLNMVKGKPLTEDMKNALVTSTDADGGYLVPEEFVGTIIEQKRQYLSLKDVVEVIGVTSAKGAIPVEDGDNGLLVNFDEATDIAEQNPKFKNLAYGLKTQGGLFAISNNLIQDEKAGMSGHLFRRFARKAVRTENADIIAALKAGKTKKAIADVPALQKAITKDLDPALLVGAVVICNQDAFYHLEQETDLQGRPLLQSDVADASKKTFKGLPIVVLSNAELPTVSNKAPIFVGNFTEAVKFFDRKVYEVAISSEAGFKQNVTFMRCIQRTDVKVNDAGAYINGEIDVTATV